jgi:hypothetical protein
MVIVGSDRWSGSSNVVAANLARTRSAANQAPSVEVFGSKTTNSSPPQRAMRSPGRRQSWSSFATSLSTKSPAGWPKWSFTCLKWSMSARTTHSADFSKTCRRMKRRHHLVEPAAIVEAVRASLVALS